MKLVNKCDRSNEKCTCLTMDDCSRCSHFSQETISSFEERVEDRIERQIKLAEESNRIMERIAIALENPAYALQPKWFERAEIFFNG